jgi:integral membrane sensor domain MASE1
MQAHAPSPPLPLRLPGLVTQVLLFGLAYGALARLGLAYSSLAPNVTLIWAPTGLSLFVVLRWGPRFWPGIVLGDLIANAGTGAPMPAILGISAGNVLQTLGCISGCRTVRTGHPRCKRDAGVRRQRRHRLEH